MLNAELNFGPSKMSWGIHLSCTPYSRGILYSVKKGLQIGNRNYRIVFPGTRHKQIYSTAFKLVRVLENKTTLNNFKNKCY